MTKIPKQPLSFPRPAPMGALSQQAGRPGGLRGTILRRLVARWCRYCTLCHAGRHIHKQRSLEADRGPKFPSSPYHPLRQPPWGRLGRAWGLRGAFIKLFLSSLGAAKAPWAMWRDTYTSNAALRPKGDQNPQAAPIVP